MGADPCTCGSVVPTASHVKRLPPSLGALLRKGTAAKGQNGVFAPPKLADHATPCSAWRVAESALEADVTSLQVGASDSESLAKACILGGLAGRIRGFGNEGGC